MDGKFSGFMIRELRILLEEIEGGLQPSNVVLHEKLSIELRKQFDRDHEFTAYGPMDDATA